MQEDLPVLQPFDQGDTMNEFVALASATGDTTNLQTWIKGNRLIPIEGVGVGV